MKRLVCAVPIVLLLTMVSTPARADDFVDLVCVEIPMPAVALAAISSDPLFREAPVRDYASLVNTKAHPMKKDVYFVQCKGENMAKGSIRYVTACRIIADSFGQWAENGTGRGGQRFVWQTWNCADVLNRN